jgi:hypothetical protein
MRYRIWFTVELVAVAEDEAQIEKDLVAIADQAKEDWNQCQIGNFDVQDVTVFKPRIGPYMTPEQRQLEESKRGDMNAS